MPEFEHIMREGEASGARVGLEPRQREERKSKQEIEKYYKYGGLGSYLTLLGEVTKHVKLDMITGEPELLLCEKCKGTKF